MIKNIDNQLFKAMIEQANNSERKRSHYNFHEELTDPIQRLCVALKKGTYIRAHKHKSPKWEMIVVLKGEINLFIFAEDGCIKNKIVIAANGNTKGVEIPEETWHTLTVDKEDAVILEIKQGPYIASGTSDFATWAPEEGVEKVNIFLDWLNNARTGEKFSDQMHSSESTGCSG